MNISRNSEFNETEEKAIYFFTQITRSLKQSDAASWTSRVPAGFAGNPGVQY
jgi:hypothetical protein